MKLLIWILCILAGTLLQNAIARNGVRLGAIPIVALYAAVFAVAKLLCKSWDNRNTPESYADTQPPLAASASAPAQTQPAPVQAQQPKPPAAARKKRDSKAVKPKRSTARLPWILFAVSTTACVLFVALFCVSQMTARSLKAEVAQLEQNASDLQGQIDELQLAVESYETEPVSQNEAQDPPPDGRDPDTGLQEGMDFYEWQWNRTVTAALSRGRETYFIGDKSTDIFHCTWCQYVPDFSEREFLATPDYAQNRGFEPCWFCRPDQQTE